MFNITYLIDDIEAMVSDNHARTADSIMTDLEAEHGKFRPDEKATLMPLIERTLRAYQPRTGPATGPATACG